MVVDNHSDTINRISYHHKLPLQLPSSTTTQTTVDHNSIHIRSQIWPPPTTIMTTTPITGLATFYHQYYHHQSPLWLPPTTTYNYLIHLRSINWPSSNTIPTTAQARPWGCASSSTKPGLQNLWTLRRAHFKIPSQYVMKD